MSSLKIETMYVSFGMRFVFLDQNLVAATANFLALRFTSLFLSKLAEDGYIWAVVAKV